MNRPYYKKQRNNNNSGRGGYNRGPRPAFGQSNGRKMSTFNPSHLVSEAKEFVPQEVFVPTHQFADFDLDTRLKLNINAKNYVTPTPIQDQAIPAMLEGRDVIGIANT